MTLKVVFCWSDISGYMAACWRALHQLPDVNVFVVAFRPQSGAAFTDQIMQGIPCELLDAREAADANRVQQVVASSHPDIVVVTGWFHIPYRKLTASAKLRECRFIMGMDTPWRDNLRQRLAPWALYTYFRKIDAVMVPGERSWQYARRLGFAADRIARGLYGIDYGSWASRLEHRSKGPWPRRFLYVGRYVEVKALDILASAYRRYRRQVSEPWPLICCGGGESGVYLHDQPGIEDRGFVPPSDLWREWESGGVFVLASRADAWPLALVEAAAAGLPILCTDACGSAVEVVRDGYNGYIVPENNVGALADAMVRIHRAYDELPTWGTRSQQLAAPYSAEQWARRWRDLILRVHQPSMSQEIGVSI